MVQSLHAERKFDHVVGLIEAALIHSQSQPWMYEVLAISMELAGRPKEDIERVSMSMSDFGEVSYDGLLQSARYLAGLDVPAAALRMLRQAATLDPDRPEVYLVALQVIDERPDDDDAIRDAVWAVSGVLATAHDDRAEAARKKAVAIGRTLIARLQKSDPGRAAEVAAALNAARQVDVAIAINWSGPADLDLSVLEPGGSVCSGIDRVTPGGGIHLGDGFGPVRTEERYVCPRGFNGDYEVRVVRAVDEPTGGRVKLSVAIRNADGTVSKQVQTLTLKDGAVGFAFTLEGGRRVAARNVVALAEPPKAKRLPRVRRNDDGAEPEGPVGAFGFAPVVQTLSEGSQLSGAAVVSPDRRYVRIGVQPWFSTVTDVFTFTAVR